MQKYPKKALQSKKSQNKQYKIVNPSSLYRETHFTVLLQANYYVIL